ncbi:MAG: SpoIIE family protein phosphatase [Bacteroidales bacterium]|nr:SpoIIE family protein phosphatase [Bacteroidales bacterium]MBR2201528.1 SpoIIE family protein phosphatase [Bacteroidales bacterium]
MNLTILDILLIITTVAAIAVAVAVMLTRKRFASKTARRMDDLYTSQIRDYESEIRRLNTLLDDETRRNKEANPSLSKSAAIAQAVDIEKMAAEQKSLEGQQQELTERNQILWDMSVSIEKERQRIEQLKNVIESHHRSVTSSIEYAKLIQDAVLPAEEILKESFADVFLFWRPRDIVSGDFYWMKRIGDIVIFTVADCTGHGVPGAFMSMLGVAFLNEICVDFTPSTRPSQILEEMRRKVIATLQQTPNVNTQNDGMDMALCVLNLATTKMQFAGANNGMLHVRGTTLTEYKPVRNPIAIYPRITPFVDHDVDIQSGDYVYMYSDGYADQFSDDRQKFTNFRFRQLMVDINTKTKSAAGQSALLGETFDNWRGTQPQLDDILVGGYCIK